MMKRYLIGRIHTNTLTRGTDKAFYVELDDGRWAYHNNFNRVWIAHSLCEVSEPNEYGWCEIRIPIWLFTKNRVNYDRIRDITWIGLVTK